MCAHALVLVLRDLPLLRYIWCKADLKARGVYVIRHDTVPDLAAAGSGDGDGEKRGEDVDGMDGCSEDEEWQDFNFDVGSQTTLASIKEEG